MISVDLDKIVTAKGLQSHLASILYEVEEDEKIYIVTKQGKPRAAIVNVDYLQELTGQKKLATTEYEHYDRPPRDDAPAISEEPPAKVRPIEPTITEVVPPVAPVAEVKPLPPAEPPTPPPPQITDLQQFTAAPDVISTDEDPYAVTDEQHFDMNGLPIKGQPDSTDAQAV